VGRWQRRHERTLVTEYQVRWERFGVEHDEWLPQAQLEHYAELVRRYDADNAEHQHGYRTRRATRQPSAEAQREIEPPRATFPRPRERLAEREAGDDAPGEAERSEATAE
jgi:hypothetical protein